MANKMKKSPTVFYWLSLVTSAATVVMFAFHWFTFQVASFGINNMPQEDYYMWDVERFLMAATKHVKLESADSFVSTLAVLAMAATAVAMAVHIVVSLVTMRHTPPVGIIPGAVALVTGLGFLIVHTWFKGYIATYQLDELDTAIFNTTVAPYLVIMLAVATVVFGLLHRQESRALYAVKHPREFVFPPENPETV